MKLLFDQNLPQRLVRTLADAYLRDQCTSGTWGWPRPMTRKSGTIHQRSFLLGHPPKVIWIRRGNCSTAEIETLLHARQGHIVAFGAEPDAAFLVLD